jgi:phosphoribosylformylglycinamidine cyclo-ligase
MDYLATGKLELEVAERKSWKVSPTRVNTTAALIGGETAEMPGFYPDGEYDLAGLSWAWSRREKS